MKGDKMAKGSSIGGIMRRRLSNITNLPPDAPSAKELIDHLVKEKMNLLKLIQDKNKIIELSGIEIQNLRNCLQKMRLQNWSLAQANSHMAAELNFGKERLKALQHENMCKEALLKTKTALPKETNLMNEGSEIHEDTRGRCPSRCLSLGSSTISQSQAEKETALSKRRCMRRQSARIRTEHDEQAESLFEIDEAKLPPAVPTNSPKLEGEARRTSTVRPLRRATEKVQSYKEIPLNVKMRREK